MNVDNFLDGSLSLSSSDSESTQNSTENGRQCIVRVCTIQNAENSLNHFSIALFPVPALWLFFRPTNCCRLGKATVHKPNKGCKSGQKDLFGRRFKQQPFHGNRWNRSDWWTDLRRTQFGFAIQGIFQRYSDQRSHYHCIRCGSFLFAGMCGKNRNRITPQSR